jgi:hypothetical protein
MRAPLLIAAFLAVSACGKNAQVDNSVDSSEQMTADSIVANDVTALDAVTGAAANMAADVDVNYGPDVHDNSGGTASNADSAKKPAASAPRKPASAAATEMNSTASTPANSVTNAE